MPVWFIGAGLRFFATAVVLSLFLVAFAPLTVIRQLGAIAGLALHLFAMRVDDPEAFLALRHRLRSPLVRADRPAVDEWS